MLQNLFFTSVLNISNPVNIPYFDQLFYYYSFSLFYSKYKVFSIYFVDSHMSTGLKKYLLNFFCRNSFSRTEAEV